MTSEMRKDLEHEFVWNQPQYATRFMRNGAYSQNGMDLLLYVPWRIVMNTNAPTSVHYAIYITNSINVSS
jgi:hypothetical protein